MRKFLDNGLPILISSIGGTFASIGLFSAWSGGVTVGFMGRPMSNWIVVVGFLGAAMACSGLFGVHVRALAGKEP